MGSRHQLWLTLVSHPYHLLQLQIDYVLTYLAHNKTISVLNYHAAVIASDRRKGSPIFYEKFATFVKLFKKSGYDQEYLEERTSVTDAYWDFVKCFKEEVSSL